MKRTRQAMSKSVRKSLPQYNEIPDNSGMDWDTLLEKKKKNAIPIGGVTKRVKIGRPPKFKDPETLWQACLEYFIWIDDNPMYVERLFNGKARLVTGYETKKRPYTLEGLCVFLFIIPQTWYNLKKRGQDFLDVTEMVENIIKANKFEGAIVGLYKENIIARDLGLKDTMQQELTEPEWETIQTEAVKMDMSKLSTKELVTLHALMLKAENKNETER